jgi:serine protease
MSALEILRAVAAAAGGQLAADSLPSGIVRFALEYGAVPDLDSERQKLADLLQSKRFELTRLADDPADALSRFLALQFPGVHRTLSPDTLYAMASELRDSLKLVSCEPDIGSRLYGDPDVVRVPGEETESAIVDAFCRSQEPTPADTRWALKAVRAPAAWQLSPKRGEGSLVGQPDTGVATHSELETGALLLAKAANIVEGGTNPRDPLDPDTANPGHGTATSSVVVSRDPGRITGVAPQAELVPIRCIKDVKIFDGVPVAKAVAHARKVGCHVITMSLGGIFSQSLNAAIAQAVKSDIIVLAAAGNCIGFVVYPASDDDVIAVAGVDINDQRWRGSSRGSKVDISAPAENVWVARRAPGDGGNGIEEGGQGTSYAVALTAGVAALWLAHHGRDAIRKEAKDRGTNVQELFRAALKATARVPADWDSSRMGAGVVDAEKLLKLALKDIPAPAEPEIATIGIEGVFQLAAARREIQGFDWARHGAEASFLAADAERRGDPNRSTLVESARRPRPTKELAATAPEELRRLIEKDASEPLVQPPSTGPENAVKALPIIAKEPGPGTEAVATITFEAARRNLENGGLQRTLETADKVFSSLNQREGNLDAEAADLRRKVMTNAERVAREVVAAGPGVRLSEDDQVTLEAIVELTNRPALRVRDGTIDVNDPLFGEWGGTMLVIGDALKEVTRSVGRIDIGGQHAGTGFVIAPGLVMTNRHVLEALADEVTGADGKSQWLFSLGPATINFDDDAAGSAKRFAIKSVAAAGRTPTFGRVDFANLDMAILEVETSNAAGTKLPKPVKLHADAAQAGSSGDLFLVGYPARPSTKSLIDPVTGQVRQDVAQRIGKIFGLAFSVKYVSPGEIDNPVGTLATDQRKWIFAHDATSLGGNSGSCAFKLADPLAVAGLHFAGGTLRANFAHGLAAVKSSGVIAANILDQASWV